MSIKHDTAEFFLKYYITVQLIFSVMTFLPSTYSNERRKNMTHVLSK